MGSAQTVGLAFVGKPGESAAGANYLDRNRAAWDRWAPRYVGEARKAWEQDELRLGLWGIPEPDLRLFDGMPENADVIELGCGAATTCAWLARRGAHPVGIDFSRRQVDTALALQRDHQLRFPLLVELGEQIGYADESFDLVLSEYGVSLWSDPRRWLPEANRVLRPGGRLIFFTNSAMLLTCTPASGEMPEERLVRDYFDRYSIEFEEEDTVEFHLTHGGWIDLLSYHGFGVERLVEVRPPRGAVPRHNIATLGWARRWPSEDIWAAKKIEHYRPKQSIG